jgi:hypothetical protein
MAWLSGAGSFPGRTEFEAFGTWRGRPNQSASSWVDNDSDQVGLWPLQSGGMYSLFTGALSIAIGGFDSGETWAGAAAGSYDSRWTSCLTNMKNLRTGVAGTVYIRPFHEMNGYWYPWSVYSGNETDFVTAWRRFRALQQSIYPASKLVFCPNRESSQLDWRTYWPGNSYVDVVGVDYYNRFPTVSDDASWTSSLLETSNGAPKGLQAWLNYAASVGKPLSIDEWAGCADQGDNPIFIQKMHDFFVANGGTTGGKLLYENYFDSNDSTYADNFDLSPNTRQPNTAAKYQQLWTADNLATLTVSSGGTYTGGTYDHVTVTTSAHVELSGLTVSGTGELITYTVSNCDIDVHDCTFSAPVGSADYVMYLDNWTKVRFVHNTVTTCAGIRLSTYMGGGGPNCCVFTNNDFHNINVALALGARQMIQLAENTTGMPGVDIGWNRNTADAAVTTNFEDTISMYNSYGASTSDPVRIHDNLLDGCKDTSGDYTGGGIILGDQNGGNLVADSNVVLRSDNYGLAINGGNYCRHTNSIERAASSAGPAGNGAMAWDSAGFGISNSAIVNCDLAHHRPDGMANLWNPAGVDTSGTVGQSSCSTADENAARSTYLARATAAGQTFGAGGGGGGGGGGGTATLANNAAGGTNGTAVTTANSGGTSGDAFSSVAGTVVYDNTHYHSASYAYKNTTVLGQTYVQWTGFTAATTLYARFYMYVSASPTATIALLSFMAGTGNHAVLLLDTATNKLHLWVSGVAEPVTTNALPSNAWCRIEAKCFADAAAGYLEVKLFNSPDSVTPTETITTATGNTGTLFDGITFGDTGYLTAPPVGFVYWIDDLAIGTAGYVGPINTGTTPITLPAETVAGVDAFSHVFTAKALTVTDARTVVDALTHTSSGGPVNVGDTGTAADSISYAVTGGIVAVADTGAGIDSLSRTVTGGPTPVTLADASFPAFDWLTHTGGTVTPPVLAPDFEKLEWVDPDGNATLLTQRLSGKGRWMPPVKIVRDQYAGLLGTRARQVTLDTASVIVPVLATASTFDDYRNLVRTMASSLNPLRGPGKLRATLTHADASVTVREMVAYYTAGMDFPEDQLDVGYPSLLFNSEGPPYWTDAADTTVTYTNNATAYTWFPLGGSPWTPLILNQSTIYAQATVVNDGDAPVYPVWSLTGPAAGVIQLDNLTTDKSLWFNYTLTSGQTSVVVDTRPGTKSITQGPVSLYRYLTAWDMWPLEPGRNDIVLTVPGATAATQVQLTYRRGFLAA